MPGRRVDPSGGPRVKLSILGGGGFRTPFVWQALLRDTGTPRVDRV
ncbi:MAG: hypothetical protein HY830_12670, partial [Actinobacteria bacterium]|nr:hypothetical protein [Actinomycetota bacterium]